MSQAEKGEVNLRAIITILDGPSPDPVERVSMSMVMRRALGVYSTQLEARGGQRRIQINWLWTSDISLTLHSSRLVSDHIPARHFMHGACHQMLDQVVENNWDHDPWVRGQRQ